MNSKLYGDHTGAADAAYRALRDEDPPKRNGHSKNADVSDVSSTQRAPKQSPLLASRILLGKRLKEGVPPPDYQEPSVIVRGQSHLLFGATEQGKTIIAAWLAKQAINRGERVLYLDAENGWKIVGERLEKLGADIAKIDENLVYIPFPELDLGRDAINAYLAALEEFDPDLVIFDSLLNFLMQCGLSEDTSTDIEAWAQAYSYPARNRGMSVAILDHTGNAEDNRPRGSSRKLQVVDFAQKVRKTQPFDRNTVGEVTLVAKKDRPSVLPKVVKFAVGGTGDGRIQCRMCDGVIEIANSKDNLKPSERHALELLRVEFGLNGATKPQWRKKYMADNGSSSRFYDAAKALVDKGWVEARKIVGDEWFFPIPDTSMGTNIRAHDSLGTGHPMGTSLGTILADANNDVPTTSWASNSAEVSQIVGDAQRCPRDAQSEMGTGQNDVPKDAHTPIRGGHVGTDAGHSSTDRMAETNKGSPSGGPDHVEDDHLPQHAEPRRLTPDEVQEAQRLIIVKGLSGKEAREEVLGEEA